MEVFDIYSYKFRFEDSAKSKLRPVLILKNNKVAKITSHLPRDSKDYLILNYKQAGLRKPSTIRFSKILDLELKDLSKYIGHLQDEDIKNINEKFINKNEGINKMNNELITNFLETVYNWFLGYRFNVKTLDDNTVDIKFNEVPDDDLLGLIDAIGQEYDIVDQGNNFIEVIYSVKEETTPRLDDFDDYEEPYWEYEPTQLEENIVRICPNCDAELEFEDGHYYCPVCDETKQEIYQDTEWEDWVDKHPVKEYSIDFTDDFSDGPIYEDEVIPEEI